MKTVFRLVMVALSISGCAQDKNIYRQPIAKNKSIYDIDKYIFPEAKDITENNFVEKLNSQIKHYNTEPIYYYRTNKKNCLIEISIN